MPEPRVQCASLGLITIGVVDRRNRRVTVGHVDRERAKPGRVVELAVVCDLLEELDRHRALQTVRIMRIVRVDGECVEMERTWYIQAGDRGVRWFRYQDPDVDIGLLGVAI